jgi:hypothetical protein
VWAHNLRSSLHDDGMVDYSFHLQNKSAGRKRGRIQEDCLAMKDQDDLSLTVLFLNVLHRLLWSWHETEVNKIYPELIFTLIHTMPFLTLVTREQDKRG